MVVIKETGFTQMYDPNLAPQVSPRPKDPYSRAKQIFDHLQTIHDTEDSALINPYLEALAWDSSSKVEDTLFVAEFLFTYPEIGLATIGIINDEEKPLPMHLLVEQAEDILTSMSEEETTDEEPFDYDYIYSAIKVARYMMHKDPCHFAGSNYWGMETIEEGDIFWYDMVPNIATAL